MGSTDPDWLVSDSLKIVITIFCVVATVTQIRREIKEVPAVKRFLHKWDLSNEMLILLWLARLHGVTPGLEWRFNILISTVVVGSLSLYLLYVCYMIIRAQYSSANLSSRIPKWFKIMFLTVAVLNVMSQAFGAIATIITNNYHFSIFRHVATGLIVSCAGGFNFYLIVRLKRMLWKIPTQAIASEKDDNEISTMINSGVHSGLTRLLVLLGLIIGCGISATLFLTIATERHPKPYSEIIRIDDEHYSVKDDIVSFWSIVLCTCFCVYYSWVRMGCQCPIQLPMFRLGIAGVSALNESLNVDHKSHKSSHRSRSSRSEFSVVHSMGYNEEDEAVFQQRLSFAEG
mmetsp:Transcript_13720/g.33550  ORF Transcript_13720/g.33550 Transcript_13720/m.33550 type:complete len:344 (-) Transcript_13720:110-1141(-)